MAGRTLPGLGLTADWDLGEDGYKDQMDASFLKLSVLTHGRVTGIFAAEPGAPAEGDRIILDDAHATNPNSIAVYDEAAWRYFAPTDGMMVWSVEANDHLIFTVADGWVAAATRGYRVGWFYTTALAESEIAAIHVFTRDVLFPADWAGSEMACDGLMPAVGADLVMKVFHTLAGVTTEVGTITLTDAGVVTFTSLAGAPVLFEAGSRMRIVGPAVANTATNVSGTMEGILA